MRHRSRSLHSLLAVVFIVAAACSSPTDGDARKMLAPESTVRIRNASQSTLTAVRIATGPNDEVTESSIAAGQTSVSHGVTAVYSSIAVRATSNGQDLALIPVEGFDAFNPRLVDGDYVVVIDVGPSETAGRQQLKISLLKEDR